MLVDESPKPSEIFCVNHSHAERCPVCGGSGILDSYCLNYTTCIVEGQKSCHGCGGFGWVTVRDQEVSK